MLKRRIHDFRSALILLCMAAASLFSSSFAADGTISSNHAMVSSAHELATRAGLDILKRGGSAVDAAVAV